MKTLKILRTAVITLLSVTIMLGVPMNAFASDADDALNDPDWNSFVEERIEQYSAPGLSLVLVNDSDVGFKSYGYADISENIPMTEDSVLGIGSCSKAFTALTIFLLQEEGKLTIDDSVSDYLPWWNVTWKGEKQDTKIWQLLDHCSGLPDSTMMKFPIGTDDSLREKTARIAENMELAYEPGTEFQYCNLGYDVLAYITETVSGMHFEDYVSQEIFQPLGMTNSGYDIPTAQGYRWLFGKMTEYDEPPFKGCLGDGAVRSTAKDMACWINAQLGNAELPEKLEKAIAASHEMPDKYKVPDADIVYANGWMIEEEYRDHAGTNPNFSSFFIVDEERNIGIFAVSNSWTYTADYAARSLYNVVKGNEIDRQPPLTDILKAVDMISLITALVGIAFSVITLILLFTQKRRLAKKQISISKERKKLIVRCIFLVPLLAFIALFHNILLIVMGYGPASYRMVGVWLPYSFLLAIASLCLDVILMIVSSIARFIHCKKLL